MIILAQRPGETVEIHYSSFGQLRNIARHAKKWGVELIRTTKPTPT
jgi:hypothetical protein